MFSVKKIALVLSLIAVMVAISLAYNEGRSTGYVAGMLEGKISVLTTSLSRLDNYEISSWSPKQGDAEWSYDAAWAAEDRLEERIRLLMQAADSVPQLEKTASSLREALENEREQLRSLRTGLNALVVGAEKELRLSASKH
jgi:hypothetical protein